MRTGFRIVPFVIACFTQSTYSDSGQTNVLTTDCPKYIRKGTNLSCTCQATGNTVNTEHCSPNWKGQSGSAQLVKNDVCRHDNGTVFTCVMCGEDEVTVNYTLLVAYGPEKVQIQGPSAFITNGSQEMTLTCNTTDFYPGVRFYWGNVKCQSPILTPTCIFRPRGRYDEGKNISCSAFNKEFQTYSATDIFSLRLHYPPERAPDITTTRKVNSTTVHIVTCTVKDDKRPSSLLMPVTIGCLTFVALIVVSVFTSVLYKRLKTAHLSDTYKEECNVDNILNYDSHKQQRIIITRLPYAQYTNKSKHI